MTWPDTNCHGPHKPRQRMVRWMHTKDCLEAYPFRNKRRDIEPTSADIPEDATIVERGRSVGAI